VKLDLEYSLLCQVTVVVRALMPASMRSFDENGQMRMTDTLSVFIETRESLSFFR